MSTRAPSAPAVLLVDRRSGLVVHTNAVADAMTGGERLAVSVDGWGTAAGLHRAPDGAVVALDAADGLMLGVSLDTTRTPARLAVAPGSMLPLYTDGLTERRGVDPDDGLAALAEVLRRLPRGATADQTCGAAVDHAGAALDDDVAVLAVHIR